MCHSERKTFRHLSDDHRRSSFQHDESAGKSCLLVDGIVFFLFDFLKWPSMIRKHRRDRESIDGRFFYSRQWTLGPPQSLHGRDSIAKDHKMATVISFFSFFWGGGGLGLSLPYANGEAPLCRLQPVVNYWRNTSGNTACPTSPFLGRPCYYRQNSICVVQFSTGSQKG